MQQAIEHCTRGLSTWHWASNDDNLEPDIVLACAGDVMTMETVAAAWWLRHIFPELKVRVVNIVDLTTLYTPDIHPHGLDNATFIKHFTEDRPIVFAFHGYQRAVHQLIHGRQTQIVSMCEVLMNRERQPHHLIWSCSTKSVAITSASFAMQRAERIKHLVPH